MVDNFTQTLLQEASTSIRTRRVKKVESEVQTEAPKEFPNP